MIFEFAVEPRLVAKWCGLNEYRYFGEKFGLGQPRVMAEYPVLKNWRRDVLRMTASLNDIEKERVLALISLLTERMVRRNGEYDGKRDWLENAIKENQHWPFHAILATENSVGHEAVLPLASLGSGEPRWDLPHSQQPSRKALSLAKAVASLLELCSDVIFVDPHFNPSQLKYRRPLEAFLWSLVNRRSSDFPRRVEIQTGDDLGEAFFKSECV